MPSIVISHSHRFIFVHVYKVAGSSVRTALSPYAARPHPRVLDGLLRVFGREPTPALATHATARNIQAALPSHIFDGYYKFAFVRNPWDWHVSLYHYMLQDRDHFQHDTIARMQDFDEYIDWRVQRGAPLQRDFVFDAGGRLLVNRVGRFETLRADFARICEDLKIAASLPHENATTHADFRTYYTPRTRDLLATAFRQDIKAFGYSFD